MSGTGSTRMFPGLTYPEGGFAPSFEPRQPSTMPARSDGSSGWEAIRLWPAGRSWGHSPSTLNPSHFPFLTASGYPNSCCPLRPIRHNPIDIPACMTFKPTFPALAKILRNSFAADHGTHSAEQAFSWSNAEPPNLILESQSTNTKGGTGLSPTPPSRAL